MLFSTALGLGLVHLTLTAAWAWRWGWAPWLTFHGLSCLALLRLSPRCLEQKEASPEAPFYLGALGGGLAVAIYALFQMSVSQVVEDGFFVHSANMGLIPRGYLPPVNFLGEPLQGHYGKDLVTAALAFLTGSNFLDAEWVSTVLFQVGHFWLLCSWLRQESGSTVTALLAAGLAFFGANFGSHAGMMDLVTNNNALAFYVLALVLYFWRRGWDDDRCAWLAALLLGVDALVYETHFGLAILSVVSVLCLRSFSRASWSRTAIVLVGASLLAATEGGVMTALAQRLVARDTRHLEQNVSEMQSQRLQIVFPKPNMFSLRLDNLRPSRPFEGKLRPWQADFTASSATCPLWDMRIVNCFWYPTWCAPVLFLWALGSRSLALERGSLRESLLVFGFMGLYAALVPACVSFGYFDSETGRWLFVTAYAWAIVYGLALGACWQRVQPKSGWSFLCGAIIAWSLWFDSAAALTKFGEVGAALAAPGRALVDGSPGIIPGGGLVPQPWRALQHHYQFGPGQVAAARALGQMARREDKFLATMRDDPPPPGEPVEILSGGLLNIRGLQVGLAGILPAGLTGAPENRLAAPMFSQSLAARAFWADGQVVRLGPLGAQWLLVHDADLTDGLLSRLERDSSLKRVYQIQGERIYSVSSEPVGDALPLRRLLVVPQDVNTHRCLARQPFRLSVEIQGEGPRPSLNWISLRYCTVLEGQVANAADLLTEPLRVAPGESSTELQLVAPHRPGLYRLEWKELGAAGDWAKVAVVEVSP